MCSHRHHRPPVLVALLALLALPACDGDAVGPDLSLDALGRDGDAVTVPVTVRFEGGSFIVVPFGDPRIPEGTATAGCPVGEADPDLGIPAGFPNGGGVVVIEGTGRASLLGEFEIVQTRCAVQFFPATHPPFVNFDVLATLAGADGSRLFVRAPYAATPFTPPEVPTPTGDVVGGTGRFAGAAGELTPFQGSVSCTDATPFCLEGTFAGGGLDGEITFPRP